MENHILVGKRFELEKLKEHSLRIPVTLNPFKSTININIISEIDILPLKVELFFTNAGKSSQSEKNIIVPFELNQKASEIALKNLGIFTYNGNFLLHGLRSDKKTSLELSLICDH
jgi:hypothetical protein